MVTWPVLASLINGASTNFIVTVTASASGSLTNTVSALAATGDPNVANNNGSATNAQVVTSVTPLTADIATTVIGPATVFTATNFSYLVSVTNQGPSTAGTVLVSNTLPIEVQFVSATGGGSNYSGVVVWSIPSLAMSAATNFTIIVTAPACGSLTLTNSVLSTALTTDLNAANNNGSAAGAQVVTTVTAVAPTITTPPQSQTLCAGQSVMFNVVASGTRSAAVPTNGVSAAQTSSAQPMPG